MQRAAAASAQRKANAHAAAEQSEQAGLGGKGARGSKHQSSSSFKSMSRDQVSAGHIPFLHACLLCKVSVCSVLLDTSTEGLSRLVHAQSL